MQTQTAVQPMSTTPDLKELKHTYHPLKVARIIRETHDSCSVVFEIPEHLAEAFQYKAGQFLTLEVPYQGKDLRRCYSLASSPDWESEHKVTIKRVEDGRISNWVNDELKEGDTVKVLPPEGRFVMSRQADHMLLFGGGSGITPVISILKSALKTTQRSITLVYANRDDKSVIFKDELEQIVADHADRVKVVHRLDNRDGFLRIADIAKFVGDRKDGEYFMCGPGPFMDTVEAGLKAAGVDPERVHIEKFVSLADPGEGADAAAAGVPDDAEVPTTIGMEINGKHFDVPYEKGKTLLQAAIDAGVDAPYSCEEGFCGCCTAKLVEGEVNMAEDEALTADEKSRGYILACQSCPTTKACKVKFLDF